MPRLKDLEAVEVSLVPKAANKRKFLIFKSEGGNEMNEFQEILKSVLEADLENPEKVDQILKQNNISDKAASAIKGALKLLLAYKDELPEDIISTLAGLAGYDYAAPVKQQKQPEQPKGKGGYKYPMKKEDIEDLDVADDVKATLTALWKEKEAMAQKTQQLEESIKKQEDEKLTRDYVEIAKGYTNIAINPLEFGKVLKEIAVSNPEAAKAVQEVLKSTDAALKDAGIFKEIGSSASGASDAWGKIEAIAKEIVEKEKVTNAVAITKALEQNPDLYSEYLKEGGNM